MNVQRIKLHAPQFLADRANFRLLDKHATRWLDWVSRSLRLVTRQRVPWLERVWQRPFHPTIEQRFIHQWQPGVRVFGETAVSNYASPHASPTIPHLHHHSETVQNYQATSAAKTQFLPKPIHHNCWLVGASKIIHRSDKRSQPVANQPRVNVMLAYNKVTFLHQSGDRQPAATNQHQTERFIHQQFHNRQRKEAQRGQYNKQMSPRFEWKKPVQSELKTPENLTQTQAQAPMQQTLPVAQFSGQPKAALSPPELVQVTDQVMQQIDRRLLIWRERTGRA